MDAARRCDQFKTINHSQFTINHSPMFCNKMKTKIRALLRHCDECLDINVQTALQVSTALKALIGSPVADIITAIIPGQADDLIRAQLQSALERAVNVLTIADNCLPHGTLNEKLQCFAAALAQCAPEVRDAVLLKLASLLSSHLDGQRFRQHIYDTYTQAKFTTEK
jgi:hypothetical protein